MGGDFGKIATIQSVGGEIRSACDLTIRPRDPGIKYTYPHEAVVQFHVQCNTIWLEEREGDREPAQVSNASQGRPAPRPARDRGEEMNADTETAIQNLSKAFADTSDLMSIMKLIANTLVNIELHLQAMRPSSMQTVRGPAR